MKQKRGSHTRVTSVEVARRAGVSQPTVSRVFRRELCVSDEVRERVLAVARELDYKPNRIARSLSSQKTHIIGIVLSDLSNRFYSQLLTLLAKKLQQHGKQILFFEIHNEQNIDAILDRVLEYQVDGVVVSSAALSQEFTDECRRIRIPVVLINRHTTNKNLFAVCSDNVEAGREVANLLLDKGRKRFAYLAEESTSTTSLDRGKGFTDRLRERGIEDCRIVHCSFKNNYDSGRKAVGELFGSGHMPDAIFCTNDTIAMGAHDEIIFGCGLRIPEDVAIVGFDNIDICGWESYGLTSVHQPLDHIVDEVVGTLTAEPGEDGFPQGGLCLLKCSIVERKTT